jgi:hypothetical protein
VSADRDAVFDPAIRVEDPPPPAAPGEHTARRGYPLPPWAREMREPGGAELARWLDRLTAAHGYDAAAAYLDTMLVRHAESQGRASVRLVRIVDLLDEVNDLRQERDDVRAELEAAHRERVAAVRDAYNAGHAAGVDYAAARNDVDAALLAQIVPPNTWRVVGGRDVGDRDDGDQDDAAGRHR